jgi:molybdopterin/thiamine biosynthesis adenylyltransferase
VTHRQEQLPGFEQSKLQNLTINLIGAGGLGGEVGENEVRKGVGRLNIYDRDIVAPSNLNRQKFFREDLYKSKAFCLARNLSKQAVKKSVITGYACMLQEAVEKGVNVDCDMAVVGIDNNQGRVYASEYYRRKGIPLVFTAVSLDANHGYVFVQEPGGPCFGCMFPDSVNSEINRCVVPAAIDINKVVAGIVSYAVDSLVMGRKRKWNYKEVNLGGFQSDKSMVLPKNPDCPLCK